jgi:Tat protein translocase TatC
MTAPADPSNEFDPDQYRMSIGDHLEELRSRLIKGLIGFAVALGFCLYYGTTVTSIFCKPLIDVLQSRNLNPQIYFHNVGDAFSVFIQISLIASASLASPIILYQLWQFVAAGLYKRERKYITRYIPLSVGLFITGLLFVYFFVLPWTLIFLIDFGSDIPLPKTFVSSSHVATTQPAANLIPRVPIMNGDLRNPLPGQMWINEPEGRFKMMVDKDDVRVLPFSPNKLLAPQINLPDYIDLVLDMLLAFGLSFQMPLVVMALVGVGILQIEALKKARRYVYFALVIAAAVITPGSDIPSLVGLTIPLILLYELGLWLAQRTARSREQESAT